MKGEFSFGKVTCNTDLLSTLLRVFFNSPDVWPSTSFQSYARRREKRRNARVVVTELTDLYPVFSLRETSLLASTMWVYSVQCGRRSRCIKATHEEGRKNSLEKGAVDFVLQL